MTILFTTDHYPPTVNGIVTHVMILKKELEKRGHTVIIVTPYSRKHYKKQGNVFYLPAFPVPAHAKDLLTIPFDPITMYKIVKMPIDIVHNHLFFTGFFGMGVAEKKNIPTIATYHTFLRQYADWVFPWAKLVTHPTANWIAREYFGKHSAVIAPSGKAVVELQQAHVHTNIYKIPNGIELQSFRHASPELFSSTFDLSQKNPLIILVGTLETGKNVDLAIRSIHELKKKIPLVQLVLVGDGKLRKKIEKSIKKYRVEKNVCITGFVDQEMIASANKAADVALFVSDTDTFPTVLLEALASGKPIVSVADTAVEGLVVHEKNGLLVRKNPLSIAHALSRILENDHLATQFGKKSRELSIQFSIEVYVNTLEKLYEKLIQKNKNKV